MRRTLLGALILGTALWWSATPAAAGGWALTSLDATPEPVAGTPLEVGFTILQHGVTPARVDGDVGIDVTAADGTTTFARAAPAGAVGHYVATVLIDRPGTTRWSVRAGWFGPHDLGEILVAPAGDVVAATVETPPSAVAAASAASPTRRGPDTWRWATAGGAVVLAGLAAVDARRPRRTPVVAPAQP